MRQKLTLTVVLVILVIVSGFAAYKKQERSQKLSFPDSLDMTVAVVDDEKLTLRDLAFYIAYEETEMEKTAEIYNSENTGEFWRLFANHSFFRSEGKQAALDMAVHDTIFYQLAIEEGLELTGEEERYLANDQYDFWSDLEEEQRESLGVSEEDLRETMRKMALAEKYQYLLAAMEEKEFEEYSIGGDAYQRLLEEHEVELDETTWERVPFGSITVDH